MKTIYVTVSDERLQQLIDKYNAYSPAYGEMEFSTYLALEELKRFRQASALRVLRYRAGKYLGEGGQRMKRLLNEINSAVMAEYNRSAEKFSNANNSQHESYAVILEEYEEAQEAMEGFSLEMGFFWNHVKKNKPDDAQVSLGKMQALAINAAAEWTQVAAMCYKATMPTMGEARPVKYKRHAVGDYRCPNCGAAFIDGPGGTPFCGACSQALEWPEDKEG